MIEIFRRKFGLRIREVFFSSALVPSGVSRDLDVYIQHEGPLSGARPFWTACLDLSSDEADLFLNVSKNYRYEINRASQKDGLICHVNFAPSADDVVNFVCFYDEFAQHRGVNLANQAKLNAFRDAGNIILTEVVSLSSGDPLAMHCYITDGCRARLYYSSTVQRQEGNNENRQLIGRANKLLHWETIKEMKRSGITCYDFGGISKTEELKGIDDFKLQFGALERLEANTIIAASWLGRLALGARGLAGQLRGTQGK